MVLDVVTTANRMWLQVSLSRAKFQLTKPMPPRHLLVIMASAILNRLPLIIPFHLWLMPTTMKGKRKGNLHTERRDSCQKTTWSNSTNTIPTCSQKLMSHIPH